MTNGISHDDVMLVVLLGVGAVGLGVLNPAGIFEDLGRWLVGHK